MSKFSRAPSARGIFYIFSIQQKYALLFCSAEFCSAENNDFFVEDPNHPKNCLKRLWETKNIRLQRYFVQINDFLLLFLCFWKMSDFWCQNLIFWLDFSDFQKKLIGTLVLSLSSRLLFVRSWSEIWFSHSQSGDGG